MTCLSKHWNHTSLLMRNKCFSPLVAASLLCSMQLCLTLQQKRWVRASSSGQDLSVSQKPYSQCNTWVTQNQAACTNWDIRSIFSLLICCMTGISKRKEEQEPYEQLIIAWSYCWAAPSSTWCSQWCSPPQLVWRPLCPLHSLWPSKSYWTA